MRLAIYVRVSTTDQHLDAQLAELRDYATRRGCEVVSEYLDHGESGTSERRPGLERMMTDAKRRRFDAIACVKLDRLARSVHHLTCLAREAASLGIDLVVLDQAIDTSTPAGRLLFHTLGAIAEFERDLIRERTRAGMAAAKRRGTRLGRPPVCIDQRALERGIRAGVSITDLAAQLGVSRATARKLARQRRVAEKVDEGGRRSA